MSRLVRRFSLSRVRERAGVRARACAVTMAFVCALYPVSYTAAQGSAETTIGFKQGKVMARQLVLGPNGKPIFAEFDQAGEVAQEIGEATEENRLQGALVIAGSVYRGMVASYDDLKRRYNDAVMMSRAQYEASTFALSQDLNIARPLDGALLTAAVLPILVGMMPPARGDHARDTARGEAQEAADRIGQHRRPADRRDPELRIGRGSDRVVDLGHDSFDPELLGRDLGCHRVAVVALG